MPTTWSEIQDSNEYKALGSQGRAEVQQRYYDNIIYKSDEFQQLDTAGKLEVKNRFFSQGPTAQQQQNNLTNAQLFEQLQGEVPRFRIQPGQTARQHPLGGFVAITPADRQRQEAYDTLIAQGKTPEQIRFVLGVNKKLTPVPMGRTAGSIVGSIGLPLAVGALIPGPFDEAITIPMALAKAGRAVLPYAGAGIGGGIGEAIQVGLEEKRRITTGEFLKAFGKELAYEGAGRGAVRSIKFTLSPFIKRTIPEAAALADDFAKVGGTFPPTALDGRFHLTLAEEVSRGAFGARQVFEDMAQKNVRAAQVYAGQFLDMMADSTARLGPKQLGKEFAEGIARPTGFVFRQADEIIDGLYAHLDELTEARFKRVFGDIAMPSQILDETGKPITTMKRRVVGKKLVATLGPEFKELEEFVPIGVNTRKLKRFWIEVLQENKKALKLGRKGAFTLTPGAIAEGENVIHNLAETVPHKTMRNIRSRVLRDVRKLHLDANQDEALIKRFEQVMFDTLTDPRSVKGSTSEIQNLFNNTRQLWTSLREGTEKVFPEKMINRILKNPSGVIKEIFPKNNPTAIKRLRISLTEPIQGMKSREGKRLWMQLRTAWFDDAVEEATKGEVARPNVFHNIIHRQGPEAIAEMIPDAAGKRQLKNIEDLLTAMSKKPAAGASLFIRGGQVGGLYLMYDGWREGDFLQISTGGALVAGPYFFAKMAAHPLGSKLLRTGIRLKPGSTSLVPITARLINLANKIDKDEFKKAAIKRREKIVAPRFAEEMKRGRHIESEELTGLGLY
jgi:hypothetical protein